MSDYEDEDENWSEVRERWERVHDDFLEFEKIPADERLFSSPDLCAFALLDKKFPTERKQKIVSASAHDQIWLRIESEQIVQLTDDEILYLTRCGVMFEDETESLSMFT